MRTTTKTTKSAGARDGECSASEAARRLAITQQSLGMWANRPGAPVRKDGAKVWVQFQDFARWRESELIRQAKADALPGDYEAERTRKMKAEASLAEIELAKAQGLFVAVEDYDKALGNVLDHVMARLRSLPIRLAHFGSEVEQATEQEIERVVVELHGFDEDVLENPTEERDDDQTI